MRFEDGDEVVLRGSRYRVIIIPPVVQEDAKKFQKKYTPSEWNSHMYEWRFNMKTGKTTEKQLSETLMEFPNINLAYRYTPVNCSRVMVMIMMNVTAILIVAITMMKIILVMVMLMVVVFAEDGSTDMLSA